MAGKRRRGSCGSRQCRHPERKAGSLPSRARGQSSRRRAGAGSRHASTSILTGLVASALALSMGELGATVMVYRPGWVTLPVGIFVLTDRGEIFDGAASTMLLMLATLVVLILLSRIPTRAAAQ